MATHIGDFAALLRELKERSGRSYGQLAARLHVSTSTLHRYCNGAAVPADYAPVERLARLCGATPDELVTLHRRWLLADAARREPERPLETPELQHPVGVRTAAATAGPGRVEPAPTELASTELASAEPASAEPASASGSGSESAEPGTAEAAMPRAGSAPRSRRPSRVLGAVAAIALIAALPLALHGGRDGARNVSASTPPATRASSGAIGAIAATGTTAVSGAVSPSETASSASSGSASASSSPSASAETSNGADGPVPVQVDVRADNWDMQCGQWFLMPQQPGKVPPPPSLEQTNAWASALGGVPGAHLRLQLTVQSLPGQSVVLHALYVHVISSKPAPKGNAYTPGSGCGGGLEPASFAVNLDATVPRTKPVPGYVGSGESSTLTDFPYQVAPGDPQVLDVDAGTAGQDVRWYLELAWSSGDRHGLALVNDNGRPFHTVGLQGDPAYFYDGTTWSHTSVPE